MLYIMIARNLKIDGASGSVSVVIIGGDTAFGVHLPKRRVLLGISRANIEKHPPILTVLLKKHLLLVWVQCKAISCSYLRNCPALGILKGVCRHGREEVAEPLCALSQSYQIQS